MYTKQVIFTLDGNEYGMDVSLVSAIEKYTGVVPIPNAPACIIGILNLRGDVIPVYSLLRKFGMQEIPGDERTQLLVTRCNDMLIGYKVDAVAEILELEENEVKPVPVIVKNDDTRYAGGIGSKNGRMFVMVDVKNILVEQESAAVREFAEKSAQ